jgi:hypothetical protein
MNSMAAFSDTEYKQAQLLSKLSGLPANVKDDVFVWNDKILDRATAIVALLKVYNQVPVGESAKRRLYRQYQTKFESVCKERKIQIQNEDSSESGSIWFYQVCKRIQGAATTRTSAEVKQIMIGLHSS